MHHHVTCWLASFLVALSFSVLSKANAWHFGCSKDYAYDIIYLQDVSSPFWSNIKSSMTSAIGKTFKELENSHQVEFMFTTYTDIPMPPFGCLERGDHCFSRHSDFTDAQTVQHRASHATQAWGVDRVEGTNMALNFIAHSTNLFRQKKADNGKIIKRVVLVSTDVGYHQKGEAINKLLSCHGNGVDCCANLKLQGFVDAESEFRVVENRNAKDNFIECGFDRQGKWTGVFENYPVEKRMYKKLAAEDIAVLGLITGENAHKHWKKYYQPKMKRAGSDDMYLAEFSDGKEETAIEMLHTLLDGLCGINTSTATGKPIEITTATTTTTKTTTTTTTTTTTKTTTTTTTTTTTKTTTTTTTKTTTTTTTTTTTKTTTTTTTTTTTKTTTTTTTTTTTKTTTTTTTTTTTKTTTTTTTTRATTTTTTATTTTTTTKTTTTTTTTTTKLVPFTLHLPKNFKLFVKGMKSSDGVRLDKLVVDHIYGREVYCHLK